jgi:hypothetical protein
MPSPFPGMDPYLEHPGLWPSLHARLIVGLDEAISPQLPPGYFVTVEERVYVAEPAGPASAGRPDVVVAGEANGRRPRTAALPAAAAGVSSVLVLEAEVPVPDRVTERYLEVRDAATGEAITVVEVLSPSNKRPGPGRQEYAAKRLRVLGTQTHLVEIDLLRGGEPFPVYPRVEAARAVPRWDYHIVIARGDERPRAALYPFTVRDPAPEVPIPLRPGDAAPRANLLALLTAIYERGRYAARIDYGVAPVPPLRPDDAAWAQAVLHEHGLRR